MVTRCCLYGTTRRASRKLRNKPDLILMDIQLPSMDGYAVARSLRSNRDLSQVPIVSITSYAMVGNPEKAVKSGCTGSAEKPIDPDTFVTQIDHYLS